MRFRRARTLVLTYYSGQMALHNFLTKTRFTCTSEGLDFLADLEDWHSADDLSRRWPQMDADALAKQIADLADVDAIVVEGTCKAELDEIFRNSWHWGIVGGYYHFGTRNTPFLSSVDELGLLETRSKSGQIPPKLYQSNSDIGDVVRLPTVDLESGLFELMGRRRSRREFAAETISLKALGECLYAGKGIVGFREDPVHDRLPVSLTPSLGSRNPYELYVYAPRVQGLEPGFYHYAGFEHDLACVRRGITDVTAMFGGQAWAATASAIIFLVAHFSRTAWRYHLAVAYRSVLIEAGYIGQNVALMATEHGLSAVAIGSLKHSLIESYLGTPDIQASVVLGIALGKPLEHMGGSVSVEGMK